MTSINSLISWKHEKNEKKASKVPQTKINQREHTRQGHIICDAAAAAVVQL